MSDGHGSSVGACSDIHVLYSVSQLSLISTDQQCHNFLRLQCFCKYHRGVVMQANTFNSRGRGRVRALDRSNSHSRVWVLVHQGTSVFTRINHSFSPNLRCTPMPETEQVEFRALRRIAKGEPLSFDYTTTEEPILATPFVDFETGKPVGMP